VIITERTYYSEETMDHLRVRRNLDDGALMISVDECSEIVIHQNDLDALTKMLQAFSTEISNERNGTEE
jgi:hypothetical protein